MSLKYQDDDEQTAEDGRREAPGYPFPVYTVILIACYFAVFVAQMATGLNPSIAAAGEDKQAIIRLHEYWRLLTGATLHGGIIHIALNSYAFFSFGRIFEMLTDRAHLAIVFLISAVAGGVLSLVANPDGISVGASGGIVGLVGYLVVYSFKRRQFVSSSFRTNLIVNILIVLAYGLFLSQAVDNFAHIGGLVAGAGYAFIQVPTDEYADPREASSALRTFGIASLGIYGTVCAFSLVVILRLV